MKEGVIKHQHTKEVYSCKSKKKEQLITSRSEQVLLARLRAGHHPELWTYKHRLNPAEDPTCPRCMEADAEGTLMKPLCLDVDHWLDCPATMEQRMRTFG